jgi:indolepyruvate ferredoxin oxidoreductase beta subunit
MMAERSRITIAILALGGQGGGVLADWIISLGEAGGWIVQGTSVPGVAQRTGSTIYYLELHPPGPTPVLGLMPAPGDVDVVIASELMEAGRAMVRGFVTKDRTTLISSTHRIYAISEKSALGDGMKDGGVILDAAKSRAAHFIGLDMEAAAARTGSVISSVMFGALAGSGALPFERSAFEAAIRAGGKAVKSNLAGFEAGYSGAKTGAPVADADRARLPKPSTPAGEKLKARITAEFPHTAEGLVTEGVRRLMDYQDVAYAELYLDRLKPLVPLDRSAGKLVAEAARHLALWMSYEDVIRVADLKTRATRFARVKDEIGLGESQMMGVTDFMHPRFEEVCELAPSALGKRLAASKSVRRVLAPLFAKGRHVRTTSLRWFLALYVLAGLRPLRRLTWRYEREQARIEAWLKDVTEAAHHSQDLALELVACQELVKGYGDTHARGLKNFAAIMEALSRGGDAADVRRWRAAALADEDGVALDHQLKELQDRELGPRPRQGKVGA